LNFDPKTAPDFTSASAQPGFQQVVAEFSKSCGAPARPLKGLHGGAFFQVEEKQADRLLEQYHGAYLARGSYLFRCEHNFSVSERPDVLGLLPTADKYAVIATIRTDGVNYNKSTEDLIKWLKALEPEQPFLLTGIGSDYLEGKFTTPLSDPDGLARRMYEFCPDIVEQGTGSVQALSSELRSQGTFFLWWD
jgi:hypothetical protein